MTVHFFHSVPQRKRGAKCKASKPKGGRKLRFCVLAVFPESRSANDSFMEAVMFFKKKKNDQKNRETLDVYARIAGKEVNYITERDAATYTETVLGKEGGVCVVDGELVLHVCGHEEFRAPLDSVTLGELMSGDGVVVRGTDKIQNRERTLVMYFKYYRNVR